MESRASIDPARTGSCTRRFGMFGLEWQSFGEMVLKLLGAFVLAMPVAWEREKRTRLMGLRTFPLVSLATCAYLLIATELFSTSDEAQARVVQGLVTGMGFIGGGAILKRKGHVEGTATAASVWATGAIGMAVAYARLDIAIAISLIIFLTLRILTPIEKRVGAGDASDSETEPDTEDEG